MDASELVNEASIAFVEKRYHTASFKYAAALTRSAGANSTKEVVIKYMLCKALLESNALHDILEALETLLQLKNYIGDQFPAIYYALGKAYIILYRFNSALDAINTGLAIVNAGIHFQQFCIPMTSITIEESTKEGLLTELMNLHDEASSWHCPDAKCYLENCHNYISHCLPCRDIFFRDPAFTGLVVVTCSKKNNPCKFKFHPVCWDFQKNQLSSVLNLSDKDVIGNRCFTSDCKSDSGISIISKVEVFDINQKATTATQKSGSVIQSITNSPVKGAIKKYHPQSYPKLRRPNLPLRSSPQKIDSEEQPLKEEIDKKTRLAKLIKLRATNFDTSREKDLEIDKDKHKNGNLDSSVDILSDLAFKDNDIETMQQCRFIFDILHEFIKSNLMVHTNKVLLKWHETKGFMEYVKGIDTYLDSDIMELLLKSPKFIKIGNYICIPETLEHALQIFEQEIIHQCKCVLQVKTYEENGDSQTADNNITSHKSIVSNFENQSNQNSPKLLCSKNNVNGNNNDICQSSTMCETRTNSSKINSLNEEKTNTMSQIKNISDWNIEGGLVTSCMENEDKKDCNTSHKDKSFVDFNDIKRNNQNCTDSMIHEENSQSSIKYPVTKENTISNVLEDNFINQLPNNDLSHKFIILKENYTQLMTNYSEIEKNLIKLTKEKTDMELNFKFELEKKNSIMDAILEERKILLNKLKTYESHIAEDVPVKYEALNKCFLTLKAELNKLHQEKLDNEHNIKLLLKEKNVTENTLERSNTELLETIKSYQAEVDKKNTELITFQEQNLELRKCMLLNSLESQFLHNQNILLQGIKHCEVAIEIFNNLNYTTKNNFGFNIIANHTTWLQALNYLQSQHATMEGEYLKFKSLLEANTEVDKMDNVVMDPVNLPPYPSRSISAIICDAFMIFYRHITHIPRQDFPFVPPPLLMNPHVLPYIQHPILSNRPKLQEIKKNNIPVTSVNSNTNLTPMIAEVEKKRMEDKLPNISQKSGEENDEGIQNNLQDTNNNKRVQCNLKGNENDLRDKECIKDNNQIMAEIKTNKASSTDMINSDVPNTFNENKLVSKSNDVSDSTDCKFLSENKIEEARKEESIENAEKENKQMLINSTDKIMSILRNMYTGMSDFLLLKSLNDLRIMHNGTLTGMPLNAIIQNVNKYVLSHQIDHLCTYIETNKMANNTTTVLKGSKKQSKSKVKKKSSSSLVKLRPLKDLSQTKSSLENQKGQHKSKLSTSSGTIKKEPISLSKCPWDIIFKPGTIKNNYGESECVICMENLQAVDKLIYTLDCQHKFHKTCIKEWFQKNQSCPTCRIHCTIDEEYPPLP